MKIIKLIKFLPVVAAALMLTGCASGSGSSVSALDLQKRQQAFAAADHLIIPGGRIGPIRLGMGMDEVTATLGKPDYAFPIQTEGSERIFGYEWKYFSLNIRITFSSDSAPSVTTVETIAWSDTNREYGKQTWADFRPITTIFQTANGLGLGASSFDIKRAYSSFNYRDVEGIGMIYENLGISFSLEPGTHRIWAIQVSSRHR